MTEVIIMKGMIGLLIVGLAATIWGGVETTVIP